MSVDNSDKNGGMKTEIDLYGDDENFEQSDEVVVGDVLDEEDLKNEDEAALLDFHESEAGIGGETEEQAPGDELLEEHQSGDLDDEITGIDRRQSEADDLLYDAVITDRTSPSLGGGRHSLDENGGDSSSPTLHLSGSGLGAHTMVTGSGTMHQAQRKNSCYVGNLTWWTTDQDLTDVVSSVGISDLIDCKFYENRATGQSKGFALVSFNSERSVRECMEHLPTKQIHGQIPVIMPYTKQSLAQFEAATRKPGERSDGSQGGNGSGNGGEDALVGMQRSRSPLGREQQGGLPMRGDRGDRDRGMMMKQGGGPGEKNAPTFLGVLRIGGGGNRPGGGGGMNMGGQGPVGVNPLAAAAAAAAAAAVARSTMGLPPGPPGVGMMRGNQMGAGGLMAPGLQQHHGGFPGMMRPQMSMGQQMHGMGPPPMMMSRPPPHGMPGAMIRGAPQGMGAAQYAGAPVMAAHHGGGLPPPGVPPPGSHVNPNFYPGLAAAHQQQQQQQQQQHQHQQQQAAAGHHQQHHGHHHEASGGVLNEAEFEEIMNRNRTVSSSAISRAVSDAAAGDYASAIETLVTALSLIRQSKVAHDDRCKVLIGSLQDTLHGIEAKSYGSGGVGGATGGGGGGGGGGHHGSSSGAPRRSKDRNSTRDRSRSRDRTGGGGGGSKRRHRSRSPRSRSRDRYGDEYSPRRSRRY